MNRKLKKVLMTGFIVIGLGVVGRRAEALTSDQMTVSVTPNVIYAVQITSPETGGYDFASVNFGATTVSTVAISVENLGNVFEYFAMGVTNTNGGWTAVTGAPVADQFRLVPYFNATQVSSTTFVNGDALQNAVAGTGQNKYGQGTTKTAPLASQNLWLRLEMPTTLNTGGTGSQTMTLTVNGQGT